MAVEGGVPLDEDGVYCTVGGRTFKESLLEAAKGAAAIIEYGSCASWGGIQAAKPNPTNTVSVSSVVSGKPIIKSSWLSSNSRGYDWCNYALCIIRPNPTS